MSFSSALLLCLLMSSMTLISCAKRDVPANQPIHVDMKGSGDCLENFSQHFDEFTAGKLDSEQIAKFWNCLAGTVGEFERMSSGPGGSDNYSPRALRRFIEKYFLSSRLSDGLLSAFMDLKRVLLSGSTEMVTRAELRKLDGLLAQMKAMSMDVRPHVEVIFRHRKEASDAELRESTRALQTAVLRFANWLSLQNQTYSFAQMSFLMTELKGFLIENGSSPDTVDVMIKAVQLLPEVKVILIAGDKDSIQGDEWRAVGDAISRGLGLYLTVANGFDRNIDSGLARETLPESLASVASLLAQSASRHENQVIPLSEFSSLFQKVEDLGWFPTDMKAAAVEKVWVWFLRRLLGDGVAEPKGLTFVQANSVRQRLLDWQLLLTGPGRGSELVQKFEAVLSASAPISWDAQGRMNFPKPVLKNWSEDSRARMTWSFVLLNWLKDAYVGEGPMFLTDDQIDKVAGEILPLLQNFGWVQSTKPTIGRRILREADLFTVASNGNGKLDLSEGVRYVGFLVSAWRTSAEWLQLADQRCGGRKASCVRDLFSNSTAEVLPNMERLQIATKNWRPLQRKAYMEKAESTALDGVQEGEFSAGDLLTVIQLFQYAEAFYQRYDAGGSETINLAQAQSAYPVFGPTIEKLLNGAISGDELNAFFTFLFKYGDTPFTMFGGQVAYNHWRWHKEDWKISADRDILMSILNQLAKL